MLVEICMMAITLDVILRGSMEGGNQHVVFGKVVVLGSIDN